MLLYLSDQKPAIQPASVQLFLPEGVTYGAISQLEPLSIKEPDYYGFSFLTIAPLTQPQTFEVGPDSYLTLPVGFLGEVSFSGTYW